MSQTPHHDPLVDPLTEGARARARGRPKDACPYPVASPACIAWLEGYDGVPTGRIRDLPIADA